MVDLHHHLLPGLDDGSPDLATSVRMARMAAEDGITHVVCTPHASHRYEFSPAAVETALGELREAIARHKIALTLGTGCDFHLSYDNVRDAIADPAKYTINHHEYLLIELPEFGIPPMLNDILYDLRLGGITPILTHPERNATIVGNPAMMAEWLRSGLLVQVTANSVTGGMGRSARRVAHELLKNRWVHFLATDAHNLTGRPPVLSAARKVVAKHYGDDYATLLCETNPMAVFEGRPMGPQPEPLHLFDENADEAAPPWWKRILQTFFPKD